VLSSRLSQRTSGGSGSLTCRFVVEDAGAFVLTAGAACERIDIDQVGCDGYGVTTMTLGEGERPAAGPAGDRRPDGDRRDRGRCSRSRAAGRPRAAPGPCG